MKDKDELLDYYIKNGNSHEHNLKDLVSKEDIKPLEFENIFGVNSEEVEYRVNSAYDKEKELIDSIDKGNITADMLGIADEEGIIRKSDYTLKVVSEPIRSPVLARREPTLCSPKLLPSISEGKFRDVDKAFEPRKFDAVDIVESMRRSILGVDTETSTGRLNEFNKNVKDVIKVSIANSNGKYIIMEDPHISDNKSESAKKMLGALDTPNSELLVKGDSFYSPGAVKRKGYVFEPVVLGLTGTGERCHIDATLEGLTGIPEVWENVLNGTGMLTVIGKDGSKLSDIDRRNRMNKEDPVVMSNSVEFSEKFQKGRIITNKPNRNPCIMDIHKSGRINLGETDIHKEISNLLKPTGKILMHEDFNQVPPIIDYKRHGAGLKGVRSLELPKEHGFVGMLGLIPNHILKTLPWNNRKGCICSGKFVSRYRNNKPSMLKLQRGIVKYPGYICKTKHNDLYHEECVLKDALIESRNFLTSSYVLGDYSVELSDKKTVTKVNNMTNTEVLDFVLSMDAVSFNKILSTCIEKYSDTTVILILTVHKYMYDISDLYRAFIDG